MKPGKKKIMVQVWQPILKALTRDLRALHIRRDPYLNDLFRREIQSLASEVGFRNSDDVVARLVSRRLPDRVKLTIELDQQLIEDMNRVLAERNILRDSFINRVLFFLLAKESHLSALGIVFENSSENGGKPLDEVQAFLLNPFWHIRSENDGNFYSIPCFKDAAWGGFPNLFSLNTAISESDWLMMNLSLEDLSDALGIIKSNDRVTMPKEGCHAE